MTTAHAPTPQPGLFKPVLLRGLVSLAFGLATVFVPDLNPIMRAVVTCAFFAGSAAGIFWLAWLARPVLANVHRFLSAEGLLLALAAVAVFLVPDDTGYQVLGVTALLIAGIVEAVLGVQYRRATVLGRDWLIVAVVWIVGAIILALLGQSSYRAPIGVLGGVGVITGVALTLAALGYRHDADRDRVRG